MDERVADLIYMQNNVYIDQKLKHLALALNTIIINKINCAVVNEQQKKIAFCTAIRDRFTSISQTLPYNLLSLSENSFISIVDYGSSTDCFEKWLLANFKKSIESEKIIFFKVISDVDWSAPRAKNLAHRIAKADYYFNIDSDNFISHLDVSIIRHVSKRNIPCQQFLKNRDGTFGRIVLPSKTFFDIGGYDESMLPMGHQDGDLLQRAIQFHNGGFAKLSWNDAPRPIDRNISKLQAFSMPEENNWENINFVNMLHAHWRNKLMGIKIKDSFSTFEGYLNGKRVVIDGLNNIYSL